MAALSADRTRGWAAEASADRQVEERGERETRSTCALYCCCLTCTFTRAEASARHLLAGSTASAVDWRASVGLFLLAASNFNSKSNSTQFRPFFASNSRQGARTTAPPTPFNSPRHSPPNHTPLAPPTPTRSRPLAIWSISLRAPPGVKGGGLPNCAPLFNAK